MNSPGNNNRHRMDLRSAFQGCCFTFADRRGDALYHFLGRSSFLGRVSNPFVNLTGVINIRSTQIRAAEVNGANQVVCFGTIAQGLRSSSPEHIEAHRCNQHSAFDHILRPAFDIQQRHAVIKASQDQRTQNRAKNRAPPTHQTGAPDHA